MTVLSIFRNLAVLMILTLAVLPSTPRAGAATPKACAKSGQPCGGSINVCCHKLICYCPRFPLCLSGYCQ
jgi:hypothetical protein